MNTADGPQLPALATRVESLRNTLTPLPDSQARLSWLVQHARTQPKLPEIARSVAHLVPGCQVRLWLVSSFHSRRCWFATDSDAVTLKALTWVLASTYSGTTPEEILHAPPTFLTELGLLRHLAENRRRTVLRVAEMIQAYAQERTRTKPIHPIDNHPTLSQKKPPK